MTNQEVKELFEKRHSIREYLDEKVPSKDIGTIVEAGLLAPCGMHIHASHLYVFNKGEVGYSKLVEIMVNKLGKDPFYGAPTIIIETVDNSSIAKIQDGTCVIENMLLAASFLGYGSCWINAPYKVFVNDDKKLLKEIGIPVEYDVIAAIVVGKAKN